MKLEIDKKDLLNLIGKTQNVVEKKTNMPVLMNVLLEAEGQKLQVFATDLEVSLRDQAPAKVQEPGRIAVSAKSLFEIVKELAEAPVSLIRKDNDWLELRQGTYISKIVGVNANEYPVFPMVSSTGKFKISGSVLKEMIDKTIYSVSNDDTRYHLSGVYFEESPQDGYAMVATDGHRLSMIRKKVGGAGSVLQGSSGVIIPRKGLMEVRKLVENSGGEFELLVEGSQLVVRQGETVLMVRLIEGKFPNYSQFIPQNLSQRVQVPRESFLASLRRVSLMANQKSKAVTLALSHGKMEITSNNPELGDAKEEIEVNYSGQDIKIGFNAKYIQEVLNAIQDEAVDLEFNDHLSPGLVRPHNDQNYTCVVMPMRI